MTTPELPLTIDLLRVLHRQAGVLSGQMLPNPHETMNGLPQEFKDAWKRIYDEMNDWKEVLRKYNIEY